MIEEQTRLIDEGWDADRVWTRMVEIARRHEGALQGGVAAGTTPRARTAPMSGHAAPDRGEGS